MPRSKFQIKEYIQQNSLPILLQIIGLVIVLANLWIVSKLAPITQDLAVIIQRVEANENLDETQHATFVTHDELIETVVKRLDRIETKVDRLIER